jgi:hypothetical protein
MSLILDGSNQITGPLTVGFGAGQVTSNVAVGLSALNANTTGINNTAIGNGALINNTIGSNNVALGWATATTNTTGSNNVAIGGFGALYSNTTGANNTAVGYSALFYNTASSNTAVGFQALLGNTTGTPNDAFGYQALFANTTGTQNVAIGYSSGSSITTGSYNTTMGCQAGNTITTGIGNICLGQNAQTNSATASSRIVIGANGIGQGDNYVSIGTGGTNYIYNQFNTNATWTKASDARIKTNVKPDTLGLSFINRLNPVTFNWLPSNEIPTDIIGYAEENTQDTTTVMHGMIAQDVKAAIDAEGAVNFAGWDIREADGLQGVSNEMFVLPLINAVKELNAKVTALEAKLGA